MPCPTLLLASLLFQGVRASTPLEPNSLFGSVYGFRMVLGESEALYQAALPPDGVTRSLRVPVGGGASIVSSLPLLPTDAVASPDGAYFAYSSNANNLRLASVANETTFELLPPASFMSSEGSTVRFSRDSSRVAFTDTGRLLWTAPVDGSSAPLPVNLALDGAQGSNQNVTDFRLDAARRRVVFVAGGEPYVAPVDGSTTALPLSSGGVTVSAFELAGDGATLLYTTSNVQLWRVPLDGSALAQVLFSESNRGVRTFLVPRGSDRVVFEMTAPGAVIPRQLHSVPLDGSSQSVALTPFSVGQIYTTVASLDGQRLVYLADQDVGGVLELYSVPVDGSAPPTRLISTMVAGGDVAFVPFTTVRDLGGESWAFALSPDSGRVAYIADAETDGVFELFSVPIDGSAGPTKLAAMVGASDVRMLRISPDSSRVVYRADQDQDEFVELYSVPIDGSALPMKLNAPLVSVPSPGESSLPFALSAATRRAVFVGQAGTSTGIYSVPIDGSLSATLISGAIEAELDRSLELELSPDGRWVLFRSREADTELYVTAVDGSVGPRRISAPDIERLQYTTGGARFHLFTSDSRRIAFLTDQEIDGASELFMSHVPHAARAAR